MFSFLLGKKPNPFFPITQPSNIETLFLIIVFLIITLEPIEQLSPITTLLSIIVLWPIEQLDPILTFFPINIFWPWLTELLYEVFSMFVTWESKSSVIASG